MCVDEFSVRNANLANVDTQIHLLFLLTHAETDFHSFFTWLINLDNL